MNIPEKHVPLQEEPQEESKGTPTTAANPSAVLMAKAQEFVS